MYDVNKLRGFKGKTVGELVDFLSTLPREAKIFCDGDEWFWVHLDADESAVNIDSSSLDAEYAEAEEVSPEDYAAACLYGCTGGEADERKPITVPPMTPEEIAFAFVHC